MNIEGEKYKLVLYNFKVWIINGEHTEFITPEYHISKYTSIDFYHKWINELSTDQILYHHNFATTQAIFKQKRLAWSPECEGSQHMKLTCRENAWDFKFTKIWCSEFCMFYSMSTWWHGVTLPIILWWQNALSGHSLAHSPSLVISPNKKCHSHILPASFVRGFFVRKKKSTQTQVTKCQIRQEVEGYPGDESAAINSLEYQACCLGQTFLLADYH